MTRGPATSLPATLDEHTALSVAPVSVTLVPAGTAWSAVVSSGGTVAGLAVRGVVATRPGATATVTDPGRERAVFRGTIRG